MTSAHKVLYFRYGKSEKQLKNIVLNTSPVKYLLLVILLAQRNISSNLCSNQKWKVLGKCSKVLQ